MRLALSSFARVFLGSWGQAVSHHKASISASLAGSRVMVERVLR
jgi:hypothetical protein